ncbi:MAG: hypothetical protein LBI06_08940 [Treponema sp.]|jgi:nucleoid-associated protein YgaU|nr:hypothetical protein [Treponema sp.]
MSRKLFVVLLAILIVVQPVFAQEAAGSNNTSTIDLGAISDDEFIGALETASDVELVNRNRVNTETPADTGTVSQPVLAEETPSDAEPASQTAIAEETPADTEPVSQPVLAEETPSDAEPASQTAIAEETPADTGTASEYAIAEETPADTEPVSQPTIAEETRPASQPPSTPSTATARSDDDIPSDIINNEYFLESERLAKLAQETFEYGDYDASANFAYEAQFYAMLSDMHVAIAVAKIRLDRAASSGVPQQRPVEYNEAETWYNESLSARDAEQWENAIQAAYRVTELLAYIGAPAGTLPLPAKYTVRTWITVRDCFWNIAGRPWVYGDPHLWRVLYNANKSKLPDPNNPNLIEPGIVLDIPSIRGEARQGEWSSDKTYGTVR